MFSVLNDSQRRTGGVMSNGTYVEHIRIESVDGGFIVVDSSVIDGKRAHDDVIWIEVGTDGRWMSPEEAESFVEAINRVLILHHARRNAVAM